MSDLPPRTTQWSSLLRLLGTLLALVLLVYLLSQQGWDQIGAAILQVPPWRLGLALVLMFGSRMAVSLRWHILLRSSGLKVTFWQSLRVTLAGLFASNFLPTTIGGDVVRLAGAIQLRCDAAISAASLIVDRLVGMAGMVMLVPVGLPRLLALPTPSSQPPLPLVILVVSSPDGWLKRILEKGRTLLRRLMEALAVWLKQPFSLLIALLFTWLHMLCIFNVVSLLLGGMGEKVPFWLIGGLYSLSYFVTLVPISINGYGVQEISLTFVFSNLAGASMSNSLTMALLYRTLTMLVSLPGFLFVPGILSTNSQPAIKIEKTKQVTRNKE